MEFQTVDNENNISENENNDQNKNNLSKSEIKRIENEKRIKRIHELMELIDKANDEINLYQDELWDLLKTQIKLPNKQKRERKNRNNDEDCYEKEKEKEKEIPKKISPFDRFFKQNIKPENSDPSNISEMNTSIPLTKVESIKKQRARAISYDDLDKSIKKSKIEHFEIVDIFQIEGIDQEFVRDCLEKCDINGDIRLFKKLYIKNIPKDKQILRFLGGKNYEVKRNDLWIDDLNGNYIKNVLAKIFEKSYISVNDLEHYNGNIDQFLINQDHISQFDDDKYMEKLMSQISSVIDIKNKNN